MTFKAKYATPPTTSLPGLHDANKAGYPHWTYVFSSSQGQILYVGVTVNLKDRIGAHRSTKKWWPEVATIVTHQHSDMTTANEVEKYLIRLLRPEYNIQHKPVDYGPPNAWCPNCQRHTNDQGICICFF